MVRNSSASTSAASKGRTKPSAAQVEERAAAAAALHESIAAQVEALAGSEEWARFLAFAGAFHAYSLNNVLLILAQRPTATKVAGFRKWQELGRQVRKGERGIRIFGYRVAKADDDVAPVTSTPAAPTGAGESAGEGTRGRVFFPMLSVFDIAQTDPIDPAAADPTALARTLTGEDPDGIAAKVAAWLDGRGWTVERQPLPGGVHGYTSIDGTRRVVLAEQLAGAQAAKTSLHEAAHVLLHADEPAGEYAEHRGIKETEAESVAYVTAGLLGIDTAAYSVGYVAGWSNGDAALIRATAARVLAAVHTLADALTPAIDADAPAGAVATDA